MSRKKRLCANANCGELLEDDEVDLRDGLCYECWLQKCRERSSEEVEHHAEP